MRAWRKGCLKYIFAALLNERPEDIDFFDERIEKGLVAKLKARRLGIRAHGLRRAIQVLEKSKEKFEFPVKWGIDLQSEHERYLTEKHVKRPVVVMNYPKDIKAFYMRVNDDGRTVAAMDVLAPGIGEIIGGSQREERLDDAGRADGRGASTRITTTGTAICGATARCRTRALGSASSAPSPMSPASPTSATPSPSRERQAMQGIEA